MSNLPSVNRKYEVEAAMVRLRLFFDKKNRGDELLRSEIEDVGGVGWRRVEQQMRTHFKRRGITDLIPLVNRGWLIPTDEDQARIIAERHGKKSNRSRGRAIRALTNVDESKLSNSTRQLRDLRIRHHGAQLAAEEVANKQAKMILGAPIARPSLKPVK